MTIKNKYHLLLFVSSITFALESHSAPSSWNQSPSWANNSALETGGVSNYSRKNREKQDRTDKEAYNTTSYSPFSPGSNNLSLDVGQIFLMGSKYSDSIGSQLHYTHGVSDMFAFDATFGYSNHSDGKVENKYSMGRLNAGLRMNLSWYDKVIPYAAFGLGFYKPSYDKEVRVDDKPVNVGISPLVFGIHMGPGVNLEVSKQVFFGTSLTFHDIFGTKKYLPDGTYEDVDGTFSTLLIHAGVTF